MSVTLSLLKRFLTDYGWEHEAITENTILTGFLGDNSSYTLFLNVSEEWLILSIVPFVEQPLEECRANLLSYLAELNFYATLVKFSIDNSGNIVASVELPADSIGYDSFVRCLETLCFYADDQYKQIVKLATDPYTELISLKEQEE